MQKTSTMPISLIITLAVFAALFTIIIGFSSVTNKSPLSFILPNKYVGTWKHEISSAMLFLNKDGTGSSSGGFGKDDKFTWRINGDHIDITGVNNPSAEKATARVNNDNRRLYLTVNDYTSTLIRQ